MQLKIKLNYKSGWSECHKKNDKNYRDKETKKEVK